MTLRWHHALCIWASAQLTRCTPPDRMDNMTSPATGYLPRPLNVWGLVVLIIFYLVILVVGVWASFKNKTLKGGSINGVMLAGRTVGPIVGIFTMTATWVGGGYINGTAEYVFKPNSGLAWTQAMWGFSLSLFLGGVFFAKPMREGGYVTMLDPFAQRYGNFMAGLMFIPVVMTELFWSGAILGALGASLYVILGVSRTASIMISTTIAVFYTMLGGLYSVVFTDIVQIVCIFVGLWVSVGYGLVHPAVSNISTTAFGKNGWLGVLEPDAFIGNWIDNALLFIGGGIPVQAYLQRVLSANSARSAQILSYFGALGCLIMSIPAILIGAIAKSADWNATDYSLYFPLPVQENNYQMILPLVMQFLTPPVVSIIGLGAVSAAVMSSADSSLLASSSIFSWNIYKPIRELSIFSKKASESEILWVMRIAIVCHGIIACALSIKVNSTYGLFLLCGDFIYVVGFPQFVCVMFMKRANTYGALTGYVVSYFFRLTAGEPLLNFTPLIKYWYYDEKTGIQCFPIRTFAMLLGLITIIGVSVVTHRWLPKKWDILNAIQDEGMEDKKQPRVDTVDKVQLNGNQTVTEKQRLENEYRHPHAYDNLQFVSHL